MRHALFILLTLSMFPACASQAESPRLEDQDVDLARQLRASDQASVPAEPEATPDAHPSTPPNGTTQEGIPYFEESKLNEFTCTDMRDLYTAASERARQSRRPLLDELTRAAGEKFTVVPADRIYAPTQIILYSARLKPTSYHPYCRAVLKANGEAELIYSPEDFLSRLWTSILYGGVPLETDFWRSTPTPAENTAIEHELGGLGDGDFDVRQSASRSLAPLGFRALAWLSLGGRSLDYEQRFRCNQALEDLRCYCRSFPHLQKAMATLGKPFQAKTNVAALAIPAALERNGARVVVGTQEFALDFLREKLPAVYAGVTANDK